MICMKEKHSKIEAYLIEQAIMNKKGKQETWWMSPLYKTHKAAKIAAEYGNPLCPGTTSGSVMIGKSKGQIYGPDGFREIVEFG